jgi:hypothetical protein
MMYHIFLYIFLSPISKYFLKLKYFYNIKKCCTMHILCTFKYDVPHIFSLLFLNIFLSSNIFHNIKKYDVPCIYIYIHFKCFTIQIFSKFKYDVPHISIYFLYPISEFRENTTYFYIFSLCYLDLELINPLNTPYKLFKQIIKLYKSKNI